jgi:hypothetical protein
MVNTISKGVLAAVTVAGLLPAVAVADASVTGKVTYSGPVPPATKIKLGADPRCAAMHPQGVERQPLKVKDGGLADVLVYVKSGATAAPAPPAAPVLLDQVGCLYQPTTVVVMVGQPLKIRNSDDTLHNIHPRPAANSEFNVGQPRKGMEMTRTFDKPELMIPTGCDVHPWMRSYISVVANPYFAVTSEGGSYEIKGLPDGDYEIEAVHGHLKAGVTGKISVTAGKPATLNLALQ